MAKRTTITVETDSLLVLRGRKPQRAWCPQCLAEGDMIPMNEVGVISNLLPQEVEAWIQSDELHHIQTADGVHLICLNSMLKRIRKLADSYHHEPTINTKEKS
jgi:hypothetical protein